MSVCEMVEFVLLHFLLSKTCLPGERRGSPGKKPKTINDKSTCVFELGKKVAIKCEKLSNYAQEVV